MGPVGTKAQREGKTFLGMKVECSGQPKDRMKTGNSDYAQKA